jgi:hypothetical protein
MKQLLTISLLLRLSLSFAATGELDKISLITPLSYERPHSSSQTIKSKIKIAVGDLINTDVVGQVKSKIEPYKKDLKPYFSSQAELDAFVDKVANEGKNKILGNDLTDSKMIQFYEHLGNSLIGGIADKILSKEGVTDNSRRAMWVAKMLKPFNACINRAANALYDASSCVDSLSESLVPSAGIGIVYELSRSNLGPNLPDDQKAGFYADQVSIYKDCMNHGTGAASDVKKCALTAMKNGVQKTTDTQLSKTINNSASTPASAKTIKQNVWPGFATCTSKVGTTTSTAPLADQFMNCIDDLVKTTGTYLVQEKLSHNDAIKTNFSRDELNELVLEKKDFFKKCIDEQKRNNIRKNGMLNTDLCENQITNDMTYKVVIKTLQKTANDSFKSAGSSFASKLGNEGKVMLDKCWNDQQSALSRESCLRKTVLSFSNSIAAIKLDQAIPTTMTSKEDVIQSSLKDLQKCMDKQLPENISEASSIGALTETCTSKLTKNVASIVARETVKKKSLESSLSMAETETLLASEVDKKFNSCIGSNPSDEKLDVCSGELKKNVALILASKQIRSNAQGKVSPMETETLVSTLVNQQFAGCIGDNPSDSKLDLCVADLTKEATKSIVLAYEKKQLKEQLNAEIIPSTIKPVEEEFIVCANKKSPVEKVPAELDECTKQFSLGFARILGELKLTSLLRSVLGSDGYNDQKKNIDDLLAKYNRCLDNLKNVPMNDGLLDRLNVCTDELQKHAVNFVTGTVNNWMSSEQKDAATLMVKNEFANFAPCLGSLLPSPPYSQKVDQNVQSIMKPVAKLLAQYIDYSPEDAKRTLDEVIKKLSGDLKDLASNPNSRKELIDYLYLNGALDQFLKSMVRGKVKEALEQTPESDVPKELRNALLSKANFDTIFASAEGKQIKEMVMDKMLKPVLMEQTSMDSPLMKAGMDAVQAKVTRMLVYAPSFGDQIIKTSIQNKINRKSGFEKTIAKWIYGSNSMNWDKVRTSERGKAAEDYIRERYLMPKFSGATLSKKEEEKIMVEAEKLVKEAVTNYQE